MTIIELFITYREPYPFTELGRMHRYEKYNSLSELYETTLSDDYVSKRHYELYSCKNHITILKDGLKFRYSCYNEYKQKVANDLNNSVY